MRPTRLVAPVLAAVAVTGVSGCVSVNGKAASSAAPTSSSPDATSTTSSPIASSSSSSSSSSSTSSSSSSTSLTADQVTQLAKSNTVRACTVAQISVVKGTQFCSEDHEKIKADYSGQHVYFTFATTSTSGRGYSYEITSGGKTRKDAFNPMDDTAKPAPIVFHVDTEMNVGGSYSITFKKDGKALATKAINVEVP